MAALSYASALLERAKHLTIYCGIVKLHRTDATLTRRIVDADHMSRGRFLELFETVYGAKVKASLVSRLEAIEDTRDKVLHGKNVSKADVRQAIVSTLEFATDFNAFVKSKAGLQPFGELRGFKGRAKPLSKPTTRWVLRGMGFKHA